MIWAAMGVFGAITSAINHAWGVEKQPSYFKHKLMAFIMLVAASLLLLGGLLLVSAINVIEAKWFAVVLGANAGAGVMQHLAVKWASTVVFILVVGPDFLFRAQRQGPVPRRVGGRGPDRLVVAWRALRLLLVRARHVSIQSIHGSIAAVVVFLMWVYTSAVLLLFGAEVTAANARLRRHRPEEIPAAPTPRL